MKRLLDTDWSVEELKRAVRKLQDREEKRDLQVLLAILIGAAVLAGLIVAGIFISKALREDEEDWDWDNDFEDFEDDLYSLGEDDEDDCGCEVCGTKDDPAGEIKVENLEG